MTFPAPFPGPAHLPPDAPSPAPASRTAPASRPAPAPAGLRLPPPDRLRSDHTGWTRAHWEALADHLLAAVLPYASPGFAQLRLPGRQSRSGVASDGLEGYARTFLLAAFRIAGARGQVPPALIERYAAGLVAGTDPAHPYAWDRLTDCSQQLVEAASVALALHETRPWIFDRLDPAQRDRVIDWLAGFVGKRTWPSNWILFQVVVEQFLATVGGPHDPTEIAAGLARIDGFYLGDGWYTDGAGQNFDYYIGWAMHLYTLLWARLAGDPGTRYTGRLRRFLEQYQHFFATDGAPVHQGRSLVYRFATVAPLWLGALFDATPLAPGTTRRIASGVLRHFVERGVPDGRGLLTLGWYRPFLPTAQYYSGPGSPYWASKAFLGLLLPPDHPVWTEPELPAPVDTSDRVLALPAPGWLLHTTCHDGLVRLVNHGSDRADHPEDPHYAKFGYASHAAPQVGGPAADRVVDGHLAVVDPGGAVSHRHRIERVGVRYDQAAGAGRPETGWRPTPAPVAPAAPVPPAGAGSGARPGSGSGPGSGNGAGSTIGAGPVDGAAGPPAGESCVAAGGGWAAAASRYRSELPAGPVRVDTVSLVHGPWEVRVHRVAAPAGCAVRDGGYALAGEHPPAAGTGAAHALARRDDGLTSAIIALAGWPAGVTRPGVARAVGANALGPCSAAPYLLAPDHPGEPTVYASLVVLSGDEVYPAALLDSLRATVTGDLVVINLPDGAVLRVRLGERCGYSLEPPADR